jgi:hypothetical protein
MSPARLPPLPRQRAAGTALYVTAVADAPPLAVAPRDRPADQGVTPQTAAAPVAGRRGSPPRPAKPAQQGQTRPGPAPAPTASEPVAIRAMPAPREARCPPTGAELAAAIAGDVARRCLWSTNPPSRQRPRGARVTGRRRGRRRRGGEPWQWRQGPWDRIGGGATIRCRQVCVILAGVVPTFAEASGICVQLAYFGILCRRAQSKHTTAAALATLSDSTSPTIGMPTQPVSCAATAAEIPVVSLPNT